MTMVSHSHRFIFIHNIKVAGNSVKRALNECHDTPHLAIAIHSLGRWIDINHLYRTKYFPDKLKILPKHLDAPTVRRMLSPKTYDNFFKFIFVRNPWDRIVSAYACPWTPPILSSICPPVKMPCAGPPADTPLDSQR